ncbi:serine/threonine-protein kinase Nek10-like isoform X2 [Dysidea avara]|uniref:serine/threonine-protein kinase Nek10-like isoform X2 n=1 Tax=Dysidea avara TaxID=196820 RepID=UPI0033345D6E
MGDNKNINLIVRKLLKTPSEDESEAALLKTFCDQHYNDRDFPSDNYSKVDHLCWISDLRCVRILSRDGTLRGLLGNQRVISVIVELFQHMTEDESSDNVIELANIVQKLSGTDRLKDTLVQQGVHIETCRLLSASSLALLQPCLCVLINLAKSERCRGAVISANCLEKLLHILAEYDVSCQRLAVDLISLLVKESHCRDQLITINCLSVFLSVLQCKDLHLLFRVVGILEWLVEEGDQFRQLGGIPIVLNLLRKEGLSDVTNDKVNISDGQHKDKKLALLCGCCSLLAQSSLNDINANSLVQSNGVYVIACHVMPVSSTHHVVLQKHVCRALRYLYSMERNRKQFKRMFPAKVLESFIDVGHYVKELSAYTTLVQLINSLSSVELEEMAQNIQSVDRSSEPLASIGGYLVVEHLGQGAFGTVYKVRRTDSDYCYAMKEIKSTHSILGQTVEERERSLGRLLNEVNIIKEQLYHPNIINYYKVFREASNLYIIMELIDGASLLQYCNSLKEKNKSFSEDRIWKIFTQLVLALRYIHKDRHIIHRDLTASNVMLTNNDHLMLMDFGLAKQKQRELSMMESVVGTMVYWCPELVQNQPYTEKADVWAAGCLLYQMATLCYPFHSPNLLVLAKQIVECDYQPLPSNKYTDRLSSLIARCLTVDANQRPDIVQVASDITDVIMKQMDHVMQLQMTLSKKLEREKERLTSRHTSSHDRHVSSHDRHVSSHDPPTNCWTADQPPQLRLCDLNASSDSVFVTPHNSSFTSDGNPSMVLSSGEKRKSSRGVSISPDRLRQIIDPVTSLLGQVHKLIFITQLTPSTVPSSRRTLVKLYVKKLFSQKCDHVMLKYELHKLSTGSQQVIEMLAQPTEVLLVKKALIECGHHDNNDVITYQQLQRLLDNVLQETQYSSHEQ